MTQPATLFSPSTGGFYLEGLSSAIPDDARKVTAKRHRELLAHGGAHIGACPKTGDPVCTAPKTPPATTVRTRLLLAIKAEARRRIAAQSPLWRQINDLREPTPDGATRFARIDAIRSASNLIEDQLAQTADRALDGFPVATNPCWPETD